MDPIFWKSKIILAKSETTYAQDAGPAGALNAMLMTDVQIQPMEGEDVSRNLERAYMGAQEELPTALRVVITGSVELVGSGTPGVAPAWAPLLRACAVAQIVTAGTSVEYVPVGEGQDSTCMHVQIGPWRHVLLGGRGTAVITCNAQGIPVARVTMTGLFVRPADQARPTGVNLAPFQGPQVATKQNTPGLTIGGQSFVMRSFELNLACDVQPRMLVGYEGIVIVDRKETLKTTVQAVPYASYNPFAIAEDRTRQIVELRHGTVVGRRVQISCGQTQQRRPAGIENNQNIGEWALDFIPLPNLGDDQWKITLT